MSAITYVGAGTESGVTTGASTPAYPAGLAAGDLILLYGACSVVTAWSSSLLSGAGFTQRYTLQAAGTAPSACLYYKFATGSESGTVSVTPPGGGSMTSMFAYRGVDTVTPFDATDATFGTSSATTAYSIPAQTTVTDHCCMVTHCWSNSTSGAYTPPSVDGGYTELWDSNGGGNASVQEVAHLLDWTPAGATSIRNCVRSASVKGGAAGVALRPLVAQSATVTFAQSLTIHP